MVHREVAQFGVGEEDREVAVEEHPGVVADLGIEGEEGEVGEAPEEVVVVEAADSVQAEVVDEVGDEVVIRILREPEEDQVEGEVRNPGVRRYGAIKRKLGGFFILQFRLVKLCRKYTQKAANASFKDLNVESPVCILRSSSTC